MIHVVQERTLPEQVPQARPVLVPAPIWALEQEQELPAAGLVREQIQGLEPLVLGRVLGLQALELEQQVQEPGQEPRVLALAPQVAAPAPADLVLVQADREPARALALEPQPPDRSDLIK